MKVIKESEAGLGKNDAVSARWKLSRCDNSARAPAGGPGRTNPKDGHSRPCGFQIRMVSG
jgi:hypothetical protein